MTSPSRPAKRECLRAVALFRICAEAMFTDNMGRTERERKRWNENNAAFPNKTTTFQLNAAQKSRLNHNLLCKKLMKHINNVQIICYDRICVNMKRNDGKASVTFTSTKGHNIAVYVELTT